MLRSAAYRIAALSSMAFATSMLLIGTGVYFAAHRALAAQLDDRIAAEMSSLVAEYHHDGPEVLHEVLDRRATAGATHDLGYAIFERNGSRLNGSLAARRPSLGWQTINFLDPSTRRTARARSLAVDLPNGERLVVAASWAELEATDRLILSILSASFVLVLLSGGVGAVLLGAYLRRRLAGIAVVSDRIIAGDFGVRAPIGPQGDEFDRTAASLNTMLDRITDLLDNLRQVSSDIAHDLRTPLGRLRNQLEMALTAPRPTVAIEAALAQADELLALFSALLRLSEIEAGKLLAAFVPVDIVAVVRDIGESFQPVIEDGGRRFAYAVEDCPAVPGDRELIAQSIINLLVNAQVHTPPGTSIRLTLDSDAGSVRVTVSDDGPGIPPGDRARVLRRFARLDSSRNRPGYGLGLSLVAAVARIHRARLTISDGQPGCVMTLDFNLH